MYKFVSGTEFHGKPQSALPAKAVWDGFTEHTTAHGIYHIKHARGPIKITFWSLVSMACMGALCFNMYLQVSKYLDYQVKVLVDIKYDKHMMFPAITVCNHNPIIKRSLGEAAELKSILSGSQSNDISTGSASSGTGQMDLWLTSEMPPLFEKKLKVMKMFADMPNDEKSNMGYQRDDLIVDCEYGGYKCNMDSDFTTFYNNMYGNCYTYNSGWNESDPIKLSYRTGPQYGLALTFNIDQDEYIGDLAETAGIKIVIHPQESMPFPEDEGISVGPGMLTYIGMNMVNMTRMGGRYGECVSQDTHNYSRNVFEEIYPVGYTIPACYKTCYQTYVIERCGCGDSQYPFYGEAFGYRNVSACDGSSSVDANCMDNVTTDYQTDMLPCDCFLSCHERAYAPTISSVLWPSQDHKHTLFATLASSNANISRILDVPDDPDKYQKNLVKAVIYFRDFNYEVIAEYPAYEGGSFASDLGGILSLYLGFSMMTIIEFVEVGVDLMGLIMMKLALRGPRKRLAPSGTISNGKEPSGTEIQANPHTDFGKKQAKRENQYVYDNTPSEPRPEKVDVIYSTY